MLGLPLLAGEGAFGGGSSPMCAALCWCWPCIESTRLGYPIQHRQVWSCLGFMLCCASRAVPAVLCLLCSVFVFTYYFNKTKLGVSNLCCAVLSGHRRLRTM